MVQLQLWKHRLALIAFTMPAHRLLLEGSLFEKQSEMRENLKGKLTELIPLFPPVKPDSDLALDTKFKYLKH